MNAAGILVNQKRSLTTLEMLKRSYKDVDEPFHVELHCVGSYFGGNMRVDTLAKRVFKAYIIQIVTSIPNFTTECCEWPFGHPLLFFFGLYHCLSPSSLL